MWTWPVVPGKEQVLNQTSETGDVAARGHGVHRDREREVEANGCEIVCMCVWVGGGGWGGCGEGGGIE